MPEQSAAAPDPSARERASAFCRSLWPARSDLAGGLAAAVANAGGMGELGAPTTAPNDIAGRAAAFRCGSNGTCQINLWVRDA